MCLELQQSATIAIWSDWLFPLSSKKRMYSCILNSDLDIAHCCQWSHRKICMFCTFITDVKTAIWHNLNGCIQKYILEHTNYGPTLQLWWDAKIKKMWMFWREIVKRRLLNDIYIYTISLKICLHMYIHVLYMYLSVPPITHKCNTVTTQM